MWAKVANAFRRTDVDASSSVPPQQHQYQENEYATDFAGEHAKSKGSHLKRGSRLLDNNSNGGTTSLNIAKRVKSSLHMNANVNESNMSLSSNTKADMGTGAQPVTGSIRSIFGKARRPSVMQVQATMNKSDDALNGNNRESAEDMEIPLGRPSSPSPTSLQAPSTPLDNNRQNGNGYGYGSVRSILRDRNTPGSGQNVRFFSRDAYRVISPNTSLTTSADNTGSSVADPQQVEPVMTPFMQRIQEMSPDRDGVSGDTTRYLSAGSSPAAASSVYASPNSAAFSSQHPTATSTPYLTPEASQPQGTGANMPAPPPQLAAMFEFSPGQEHNVHSIHATTNEGDHAFLRDDAIEVDELGRPVAVQQTQRSASPAASLGSRRATGNANTQQENRVSSHSTASSMSIATPNSVINGSTNSFHSVAENGGEKHTLPGRAASSMGLHKVFKRESTPPGGKMDPLGPGGGATTTSRVRALSERMFNRPSLENKADTDNANASQIQGADEPDPFSADASNYYNRAAGFPKTPPRVGHVRSDSIMSRDSVNSRRSVSVHSHHSLRSGSGNSRSSGLSAQLLPEPGEDRDETIRALRTQLAFHQELATQYEADIRARDAHAFLMNQKLQAHEAEAERRARAMRGMRKRVADLERAAAVLEDQAERSAAESFEKAILDGAEGDAVRVLQTRLAELEREKTELEKKEGETRVEMRRKEEELVKMRDRMGAGGVLDGDMSMDEVRHELVKVRQEAAASAAQHQEIELAWAEDRARLVSKLESLQNEIASKTSELDMLRSEVEAQWGNTERLTDKADKLQKERDEIAKERESLKSEIAALEKRIAEMEVEWTESENRKSELENELNSVLASKEEVMKEREQLRRQLEHGGYSMNDDSVEQLRAELTAMRREHARMQTDHARLLSEAEVRASDAIELRNETARRQAAVESEARELREKLAQIQEENDKLKKNIQVLKHQSADQDVKILQLEKQHDQDTEDKLSLNIALDSKQQELELLKRNMGVRGTAGSTHAVPNRAGVGRRDSAAFKTPMPLRPASSLSDGGRRTISLSDTERSSKVGGAAAKPTFGKGTRPNATSTVKKASRLSNTSLSAPPGRARSSTASSDSQKTPRPAVGASAASGAAAVRRAVSPNSTATTTAGRRASIAISGIASMSDSASSAQSDKENETPRARPPNGGTAARRVSMQPLAVPA